MTGGARVQLHFDSSSAAGATSRTRTISRTVSEADVNVAAATILPHTMSAADLAAFVDTEEYDESEYLQGFVARMEALQSQKKSPQQTNPEIDSMIARLLVGHPERRHRMAVMTKSGLLRKKILSVVPAGGRALGSAVLGTTFPWRKQSLPDNFSDANWPKASHNDHGIHHLPGGGPDHDRVLRCPSDKRTYLDATMEASPFYSVPRTKRFPGVHDHSFTIKKEELQKKGVPGPGSYFHSVPRGTAFSIDGGETIVLGANHTYPWKKSLGRNINPVDVDFTSLASGPCYSFPKTRRTLSDTVSGHGQQDGGPGKTDTGCLSPGHVYELHSTVRPLYGTRTHDGTQSCVRRKIRARLEAGGNPLPKVRCIPVPPEAPKEEEEMQ